MALSNIKVNNQQVIAVDEEPITESDDLIKSKGVRKYLAENETIINEPSFEDGCYRKPNGEIDSFDGYGVTSPIELKEGDTILLHNGLNIYVGAKVLVLAEVLVDGTFVKPLHETYNQGVYEIITFTAKNNMYVSISSYPRYLNYTIMSPTQAASLTTVERHSELLSVYNHYVTSVVIALRAYIDYEGEIVPYNAYIISTPIHLEPGNKLYYYAYVNNCTSFALVNQDDSLTPLEYDLKGYKTYVATESCDVVISTATDRPDVDYNYKIYEEEELPIIIDSIIDNVIDLQKSKPTNYEIINPYATVNFNMTVKSQTHEHCYSENALRSSYNRGIRAIACSHYTPSCPRYPLSDFNIEYQDLKTVEEVRAGDTSYVTRTLTGKIPTITNTIDGDITTDNVPQIANAERAYTKNGTTYLGQHVNILGLLWGSVGNAMCDYGGPGASSPIQDLKQDYSLETIQKFNELISDTTQWQFGPEYAFGTLNHCRSYSSATFFLDNCPQIFKAMELFNLGYGKTWNKDFRDTYDSLLKNGYRIWGTSVVDWQNDWATWNWINNDEKNEWIQKYNNLSQEEKELYGSAENYYMETGRYKFDRGCNVMFIPENYNEMTAQQKAKEIIKSYINGRYYMAGLGNYTLIVSIDRNTIVYKLSDFCPSIRLVTANIDLTFSNKDTIYYTPTSDDMFVRIEATWNDGDFVYSNPIWIEPKE